MAIASDIYRVWDVFTSRQYLFIARRLKIDYRMISDEIRVSFNLTVQNTFRMHRVQKNPAEKKSPAGL